LSKTEFVSKLREKRLILPPLSGYTDYPYRAILAEFSPPFICTEMISPYAVIHGNSKTMRMLRKDYGMHMNGVQLVGADVDAMRNAAKVVENMGFDYIDINMGCTVKKVTQTGAGVSLMESEEKACLIVSAIIEAVSVPVTCKIRLGVNKKDKTAISLAKKLEAKGISALTVHGRSGESKFGSSIDYEGIKEIVECVNIPVISNGGIYNGIEAVEMIRRTGSAAVMPGRGLIGNPWLVDEVQSIFSGAHYSSPSLFERKEICLKHVRYLCDFYGEVSGIILFRRIFGRYFSNSTNINNLRRSAQQINSFNDVKSLIETV